MTVAPEVWRDDEGDHPAPDALWTDPDPHRFGTTSSRLRASQGRQALKVLVPVIWDPHRHPEEIETLRGDPDEKAHVNGVALNPCPSVTNGVTTHTRRELWKIGPDHLWYEQTRPTDTRELLWAPSPARRPLNERRVVVPEERPRQAPTLATVFAVLARTVPLGVVLFVQAWNSVRLIQSNTAFLDEATYLGAGHRLIQTWLHGGANLHYPNYFSGAPVIYPVLGSLADSLGGLAAARALSLAFMLLATILVYASARRLYGTAAGWLSAAVFSTVEATQFLGALATYDAMALSLLALATWIVIRTGSSTGLEPHGSIYLAAPVMALADATKYASILYDPVIVAIAFLLVTSTHGWRKALRLATVLVGITVGIVAALLAIGGPSYITGVNSTTLFRASGATPSSHVLYDALSWVGIVALLATVAGIGLVVGAVRTKRGKVAAVLGAVLASAVFLAPLNQVRIHTTTSLSKHVDFGAWFGAIVVGYLLARVGWGQLRELGSRQHRAPPRAWRYALGSMAVLSLLIPMYVEGTNQARAQFRTWVNTTQFIAILKPLVLGSNGPILVDDAQVSDYYLGDGVGATRWHDTFYLSYTPPGSKEALVGIPAYVSAIRHHYFSLIALDFGAQHRVDAAVVKTMSLSRAYQFVAKVDVSDAYGHSAYVIWRHRGS